MYKLLGIISVSIVIGLSLIIYASSFFPTNESNNELGEINIAQSDINGSVQEYLHNHNSDKELNKRDAVQSNTSGTIENYIIETPEFDSIESWIKDAKELLNNESFEPYSDRETYDFHVTQVTSAYARYFAIETEDTQTLEKLNEIEKIALHAALEKNENKRSEWIEELKSLLAQFLKEIKKR